MLVPDTRCQQVIADRCPLAGCLSGGKRQRMPCSSNHRDTGTVASRPVTRQDNPFSPPAVDFCLANLISRFTKMCLCQWSIYRKRFVFVFFFFSCIKKNILWRLLRSIFVRLLVLPETACAHLHVASENLYTEQGAVQAAFLLLSKGLHPHH